MQDSDIYHRSVLNKEVITALRVGSHHDAEWYIDGTLGDGGYALEILRLGGNVVGIDVDPSALARSQKRFEDNTIEQRKYLLLQGNFRDLKQLIQSQTETKSIQVSGVILDLGVSSLQLEDPGRGFSFIKSGPLDMRMDPTLSVRALDLVNGLHKGELNELFTTLGEEKYARLIADAIIRTRQIKKIETTAELAGVVADVYRRKGNFDTKIHPATRVFQALRIVINDELHALEDVLPQLLEVAEKGGVLVIISFHSLEDRIVKTIFNEWEASGLGEIQTKKPIVATEEEVQSNPRSRSAKMRVFIKG